jgi:hypothetical protein
MELIREKEVYKVLSKVLFKFIGITLFSYGREG